MGSVRRSKAAVTSTPLRAPHGGWRRTAGRGWGRRSAGLIGLLLQIQGCWGGGGANPQQLLVISDLRVRPLGRVLPDRPVSVELTVTVSNPDAVVGGQALVRNTTPSDVTCQAPEQGPLLAAVTIADANLAGNVLLVVMGLQVPAGQTRLCFSVSTPRGTAAPPGGEATSNELEFTLTTGGPSPGPSPGPAPPPAPPPRPAVTITATDAAAGEPADPGAFQISRTGSTTNPLIVFLTVAGTATSGVDYVALPPSVTIPAGAAFAPVTVTPIDDSLFEPPETIIATLAPNPAYVVGSPASATVTLTSNDSTVTITAPDATAAEPANPGQFLVARTGGTAVPLTVFLTVAGTATPGVDYVALPPSVTIPAGAASAPVAVTPIDDSLFEPPETIIATLTPNPAYVVGSPASATVTLTSDDSTVTITAPDATAAEPANPGQFLVARTGGTAVPLTVFLTASGTATPGVNYVALPPSVTIPAGAASAPVAVTPIDDSLFEPPETIIATLTPNPTYAVGSPSSATVTLTSNDGTVTITAPDATAAEPASTGRFRITRTGGTAVPLTVFFTVAGTATPGVDYVALPPSVTIPVGATFTEFTVTPIDDSLFEPPETIIATLTPDPTYAVGSPSSATVTLTSNDGTVTITAPDATAAEPASTGRFRITRTGGTAVPLTVFFTVAGTATPGADYIALPPSVTIPVGATFTEFTVTPIDDSLFEPPETIIATLTPDPTYAIGSPSSATVTLTSNDGTVTMTAPDATAAEPASTGRFRITRTGGTAVSLTVFFTVAGTATPGADYVALPPSVTIPVGATFIEFTVTPIDDPDVEGPETIVATLTPDPTYRIGSPSSATITLTSDDGVVRITAPDATAAEPASTGRFRITRTGSTAASLTVFFTVAGSATPGADYVALPPSVTIPVGATFTEFTVTPIDDPDVEGPETIVATLTPDPTYLIGSPSSATVTLTSNE